MPIGDMTLPALPRNEDLLVRTFRLSCFGLCVAQAVYLAASLFFGQWIVDARGHGIPTDFVNVWAAGRFVLESQPAVAYDWQVQKQVEDAAVGYAFAGHYGWHYPPPFLAVAGVLALLPYAVAYALWAVMTLALYVATMRWIVDSRFGCLLAGAFPAVLSNMIVGQNGFLTASLIGGALGFMERQPVLAGCCLGLLTYKPHFGMLFPIVLAVTGRWTVFFVATVVAAAMAVASWIFFGMATWAAFFHWLPIASNAFLSEGHADWTKLQSVYGLIRTAGGGDTLAWVLQLVTALLVAGTVSITWRSKCPFDLKAAALATGVLLLTPYVYLYDMVILAIAVAFFVRHVTVAGIRPAEYLALAVMSALIISFPFVKLPLGLAATFSVAIVIACRCIDSAAQYAIPHSLPAQTPIRV